MGRWQPADRPRASAALLPQPHPTQTVGQHPRFGATPTGRCLPTAATPTALASIPCQAHSICHAQHQPSVHTRPSVRHRHLIVDADASDRLSEKFDRDGFGSFITDVSSLYCVWLCMRSVMSFVMNFWPKRTYHIRGMIAGFAAEMSGLRGRARAAVRGAWDIVGRRRGECTAADTASTDRKSSMQAYGEEQCEEQYTHIL